MTRGADDYGGSGLRGQKDTGSNSQNAIGFVKWVKRLSEHDSICARSKFPNPDIAVPHGIAVILQYQRAFGRNAF